MGFEAIIGHEKAIGILKGCISRERIPHAMLFSGDNGIGKRLTAVNFAKALNCRSSSGGDLFAFNTGEKVDGGMPEDVDACEECPQCRKINSGIHPDVFFIEPEGDGGQITVSAVRKLEEALSYKPFESEWKVAVIDNADRLNQPAANAFLQTLEEPADHSVLILVSSRPEMILPTIRSRCQRIYFTTLPVDTMSALLNEKPGLDKHGHAELVSNLSGGRLGYALDENLIGQRDRSFEILELMLGRLDDEAWDNRTEMEEWFEWARLWIRDMAVLSSTGRTDLLINKDREREIKGITGRAATVDILKLARELYNIERRLKFNLNKQLTFNYTSLLLKKMLGKTNVGEQ